MTGEVVVPRVVNARLTLAMFGEHALSTLGDEGCMKSSALSECVNNTGPEGAGAK